MATSAITRSPALWFSSIPQELFNDIEENTEVSHRTETEGICFILTPYVRFCGLDSGKLRAAAALARLRHPNVIRLKDVLMFPLDGTIDSPITIAAALLGHPATQFAGRLSPHEYMFAAYQIIAAGAYIQSRGILSAGYALEDIRVYITPKTRQKFFVISNFNYAEPIDIVDSGRMMHDDEDVPSHNPPEAFHRGKYTTKSDVWVIGCALVQLLTRKPPFGTEYDENAYAEQCRLLGMPEKWRCREPATEGVCTFVPDGSSVAGLRVDSAPPLLRDMLARMLVMLPEQRESLGNLLMHPYFAPVRMNNSSYITSCLGVSSYNRTFATDLMAPYPMWLSREMTADDLSTIMKWIGDKGWALTYDETTFALVIHMVRVYISKRDIPPDQLLLYAAAAVMIAAKVYDGYGHYFRYLVEATDGRYTKDEFRDAEVDMVMAYGIDFHRVTSCDIVRGLTTDTTIQDAAKILLWLSYRAPLIGIDQKAIALTCLEHAYSTQGKTSGQTIDPIAFNAITRELRAVTKTYDYDNNNPTKNTVFKTLRAAPLLAPYIPTRLRAGERILAEHGIPRTSKLWASMK